MGDIDPRELAAGDQLQEPVDTDVPQESNSESGSLKRRTPWDTLSARVISLVSRKGGVGKTTSAINLGAALALSDHSVLLVGVDPQCGVARSLGYSPEDLDGGLGDIFTADVPLTDLAYTTPLKNLFFVTPNIRSLAEEERFLSLMEERIDTFMQEIDRARNLYDTILIDCPPGLSPATRAALLASGSYLVPVQAEELCRDSLSSLLDFIQSLREQTYPAAAVEATAIPQPVPLHLEGMFLTMVNSRTRMSKHVSTRVNEDYAEDLFATGIPRTTRLTEMALRGKPAVIYDRKSAGSRAYFDLVDEIVGRYELHHGAGVDPIPSEDSQQEEAVESPLETTLAAPASDMEQLLERLRVTRNEQDVAAHDGGLPPSPELVSLDELLAEEEQKAHEDGDWDEPYWEADESRRDRFN